MKDQERQELLDEQQILKILLDFHIKHRDKIGMSEKEFEEYVMLLWIA